MECPSAGLALGAVETTAESVTTADCLPTAVLAIVLQHIPLEARLKHCAVVSSTWKAASIAATTVIDVDLREREASGLLLSAWLKKHGQRVTSIRAVDHDRDVRYTRELLLPCRHLPMLQTLVLEGLWVNFDASAASAAAAQKASKRKRRKKKPVTAALAPTPAAAGSGKRVGPMQPAAAAAPAPAAAGSSNRAGPMPHAAVLAPGPAPAGSSKRAEPQHAAAGSNKCADPRQQAAAGSNKRAGPNLQAAAGSRKSAGPPAAAADAPVLPQLQDMQIATCWPWSAATGACTLEVLATVPSLRKLVLNMQRAVDSCFSDEPHRNFSASTLPHILQQLTGLTKLQVSCAERVMDVQQQALEPLTSLQHLQQLTLMLQRGLDFSVLTRLPPSLTALELTGDKTDADRSSFRDVHDWIDISQMAVLQGLTALQQLTLRDLLVDTSSLAGLRAAPLTFLQFENALEYEPEHCMGLLGALGQLTGLQHLELGANLRPLDWHFEEYPEDLQHFSALTASSALTALHVWGRDEQPLPTGMLSEFVLPPGKQLPNLQVLRLDCHHRYPSSAWKACIDFTDLASIAESCPALQQLMLQRVLYFGIEEQITNTFRLLPPSLTALSLGGLACDAETARGVAQLTGLRALAWTDSIVETSELQQLTALTGLTRLELARCSKLPKKLCPVPPEEYMDCDVNHNVKRMLTASKNAIFPDVWLQLQRLCEPETNQLSESQKRKQRKNEQLAKAAAELEGMQVTPILPDYLISKWDRRDVKQGGTVRLGADHAAVKKGFAEQGWQLKQIKGGLLPSSHAWTVDKAMLSYMGSGENTRLHLASCFGEMFEHLCCVTVIANVIKWWQ